ncbi:diguanylate cyclase/phosphodiesterase (GGDEF & EAL domains) with PAS/PAC sensor(s) [hydrothermal vent metagenome]|uniref:Diguanylate cyclase/phosphodiesterase (GGDEF & EAL domains) with PAS/PAC sensor(S) n=1 Tax=hydrothermal vent metagenome TaxID=652676 RepID=A0A3B0XJX9_9ZZZZ
MSYDLLNILIVEDSEDDALLLLRELKQGGYKTYHKRVDTAEELQNCLNEQQWDIVITDHNMPNFDSTSAIKLVKQAGEDIPVIIVSGSIGEDVAVNAMRTGANDYILKGNYSRLIPAIDREMREAGSRKARRDAEKAIQHMAFHDSLTGLLNRAEFEQRLEKLHQSSKDEGITHALIYLDLDQFKIVNDTSGHAAGDELLKQISVMLEKKIRTNDIIARLGGDEFGVLLENCELKKAELIARHLCDAIHEYRFIWKDKVFGVGASIGLVAIDASSIDVDSLLSSADMACYAAKDKGRNHIQIYQETNDEFEKRRVEMDWAGKIDNALEKDLFCLYQQSIVPLQCTENRAHYELLIRLRGKKDEIIAPAAFIPAAERFQRMQSIDHWVINSAFEYLSQQNTLSEHFVAINLSGQSLGDESLFKFVSKKIQESGISPRNICFEVTETAAIANFNIAVEFIEKIKQLGCKFALDDFGSGLSSFSYLKTLPVDYLKIDGIFIQNITTDPMDKAIVEAINSVAHKAGMKTIAEYVHTKEIKQCLIEMGVDYAQGYEIGKPEAINNNGKKNNP